MDVAEHSSEQLPNDIEELKKVIITQQNEIAEWKTAHGKSLQEYRELEEKYRILQHAFFGRSSEKWTADEHLQARLFDEAETAVAEDGTYETAQTETITYSVTKRKRGKRQPIPDSIPREEIVHDIAEEEKVCGCGEPLVRIGEEVTEKLDIIPARIHAIRHIRPKYACHACEGSGDEESPAVRIAPPPKQLLPKSIATAGLVAHIVTSKYCDALPLHRQEKMFRRIGVEISRGSMARWIITVGGRLSPLLEEMDRRILSGPLIQMDETKIQVHHEPGRADHKQSFMWVARGGPPEKPLVRYMYHPTRGGAVARSYLTGYEGYLQTDGYEAYTQIGEWEGIVHVGCLAHARRKFDDATQVAGGSPAAREFLSVMQKIYRVEKELRLKDLSAAEFEKIRKERAAPLFEQLEKKLENKSAQVPPSTALGRAVAYTREVLPRIKRYLDRFFLTPDNNAALSTGYRYPQDTGNSLPGNELSESVPAFKE